MESNNLVNYLDEINQLYSFANKAWPSASEILDTYGTGGDDKTYGEGSKEILRNINAGRWGALEAVKRCSENPLKDPYIILDETEQEFNMKSLFDCTQKINKEFYATAANAVHYVIEYLLQHIRVV